MWQQLSQLLRSRLNRWKGSVNIAPAEEKPQPPPWLWEGL
jgi:hypothetical protein